MITKVYIDEAGDLGIHRGTQWFVLSAVIVDTNKEKDIRNEIKKIKEKLNVHEIHLRKINDFYKRAYIVKSLKPYDFTIVSILIDTNKLDKIKFSNSLLIYNYACRLLLERVSWFLRDNKKRADIVLSARGTSRDKELINYIKDKLIPYEENEIENVFDKISATSASQWDLLQLSDVCATSIFLAYEINGYGFRTPCFIKPLQEHFYKHNGQLIRYGLKYFTNNMMPETKELNKNIICK